MIKGFCSVPCVLCGHEAAVSLGSGRSEGGREIIFSVGKEEDLRRRGSDRSLRRYWKGSNELRLHSSKLLLVTEVSIRTYHHFCHTQGHSLQPRQSSMAGEQAHTMSGR